MTLRLLPFACLCALLAGCLSAPPPAPRNWTLEPVAGKTLRAPAQKWGVARLTTLTVRAPFDRPALAVRRGDGSVAFDGFNAFASAPTQLMKGPVQDILEASGLFKAVVPSASGVAADVSVEVVVTDLALDCRAEGKRAACVGLTLVVVKNRGIAATARGVGTAETGDGDYTAAFSSALTAAVSDALSRL